MKTSNICVGIVGSRLRQARISRAMSITELAEKVGVTKQAISQYELEIISPSNETIDKFINLLKYPRSFFTQELKESYVTDTNMSFFRSNKNISSKEKEAADTKINILSELFQKMENFLDFPKLNIPEIKYDENIDEFAKRLREYWNLGSGPINNVIEILQDNGFVVTRLAVGNKKIDAFSKWCNGKPYIILGDDKKSAVRSRFDACHELYHILVHIDMKNALLNKTKEEIEKEADYFAGAFLMPIESFVKDICSVSLDNFISIKKKWKVSIASIIMRCQQLGIITDNQTSYLWRQMATRGYRKKEPLDDTITPEKPYMLKQGLELLIDNNIIPSYDVSNELNLFNEDIEKYFLLDRPLETKRNSENIIRIKDFKNIL